MEPILWEGARTVCEEQFLEQLTKLLVSCSKSVCLSICKMCVCVLTRVAQIIKAARRDLQSSIHRPTDEFLSQTDN